MFKRLYLMLLVVMPLCVYAQNEQAKSDDSSIEEVLVVGAQLGPGLWKVSKGNHLLWILGTHEPLPKFMQWHSAQVESAIAQSQAYIAPPDVKVKLSTLQIVSILPSAIGIKNNPDGEKLNDVLSPELYARWLILKEKYIGKNKSIEKERPIFAAKELYDKALGKENLTSDTNIRYSVNQLVKQYKLRVVTPTETITLESPRKLVKQFKKTPLNDADCMEGIITTLESDLNNMRINANAWARGDLNTLKKLPYFNQAANCDNAMLNSSFMNEENLGNIPQQALNVWVAEAEKLLEENTSTFAVLPIGQLYHPEGFLAALRAKGYEIVEPEL